MCGLAGFVDADGADDADTLTEIVREMATRLAHRGPDDAGEWADQECQIALGHRRLSVIDTSAHGHQPMVSASGRFIIAYNGEVYNFAAIRRRLENGGVNFTSNSDTEVILAAIEADGLANAVASFVGMFAFALWDRELRKLHLVRDRMGIKPLFYGFSGSAFVFGSELKALTCFPKFERNVDRKALSLFTRYSYVPAPYSIYTGISKQLPGTIISFSLDSPRALKVETYWDPLDVAQRGLNAEFQYSDREAIDALDKLLTDAITLRMIADVPLGAFLSGGYDSSVVAAIMQRESSQPVKTFSIGLENRDFDESTHAQSVATHLGTDHTALLVTAREAQSVIPKLPSLYDEPFSDSSQIPTFLVSQLARRQVTVSLSGDGGDELFAGYNRHTWVQRLWRWMRFTPVSVRTLLAHGIENIPPAMWDGASRKLGYVVRPLRNQRRVGENIHKFSGILAARDPIEIYSRLVSHWQDSDGLVLGSSAPLSGIAAMRETLDCAEFSQKLLLMDQTSYLPDDILTKVDRASMGVSLEARVPLIDHRVVEFAWRLPFSMKVRNGQGKWILRQLAHQLIPREIIDRPKAGFGIPIGDWLRGPLREWAEDLIHPDRLKNEGFFDEAVVSRKWDEYVNGNGSGHYHIWDVLMFQAWLNESSTVR